MYSLIAVLCICATVLWYCWSTIFVCASVSGVVGDIVQYELTLSN